MSLNLATSELYRVALQLPDLRLRSPTTGAPRESNAGCSVLVTSSHAGEGKTFVAASLACIAASVVDESVLLIDANFERPAVHHRFACAAGPGFADAIQAGSSAGIEPLQTNVARLSVMPAGERCAVGLLFKAVAVAKVLAELSARYSLIIIDGGVASAAGGIAPCSDGLILVADCQSTRREVAASTLSHLKRAKAHVLGVLLNRKKHYIPAAIYDRI